MVNFELTSLPIISGDFYASGFHELNKKLKEASKLKAIASHMQWNFDMDLVEEEIIAKDKVVLVTSPQLKIVHATNNIFDMNGYKPHELIGKTPRIFQGEQTSQATRKRIAAAITNQVGFDETVVNYKKDKSLYRCWITAMPIKNKKGKIVNFIAFEKEVA